MTTFFDIFHSNKTTPDQRYLMMEQLNIFCKANGFLDHESIMEIRGMIVTDGEDKDEIFEIENVKYYIPNCVKALSKKYRAKEQM